ncbi:hypothetical protein [Paracoccus sp. N5]|uniref:hypothetical protein n=1 Tax=Paracoccus sp. N5 TaxID=1101189 RepID=UPI0012FC65A7|nr:hypothetical protein [Paracoccus sp. N5]
MPSARNPEMKAAGQRCTADTGLDAPEKGHFPMNIPENPCKGNLPVSPAPRRRPGQPKRKATEKRVSRAASLIQDHIAVLTAQRITLPVLGLEVALDELRQIGGAQ